MGENLRVPFSKEHDAYLVKYLARYCPTKQNRAGNKVYKDLVENVDGDWPWARHHTWQSWRERYKKHAEHFDAKISRYQETHGIRPSDSDDERPGARRIKRPRVVSSSQASQISRKRAIEDITPEKQQPPTKRPKVASGSTKAVEGNGRRPVSPMRRGEPAPDSADRRSKPESSNSRIETSRTSPPPELDPPSVLPSPERENLPSPRVHTMTNGNEDNRPPPGTPLQYKSQSTAKLNSPARRPLKKRHREPPTPFASTPPTPQTVVVNSPISPDQTPTRAPPRLVNTLGRSCLVDQSGRTPKRYTGSSDGDGSEQNDVVERWPPIRRAKGKERADTTRLSHMTGQHHPFSQIQKTSGTEVNVNAAERHAVGNHCMDLNDINKSQEVDNNRSEQRPHNGPHSAPERALRQPFLGAAPGPESKPDAEVKVTPPRASTPTPTARTQPSSLARVGPQTLNGSRVEQVRSVDLAAFSASTSRKPSRPTNGLRPRRSLPAHLISLPAGRDTSAPQSMWPNSRYGSPFFAQPNRQGYPGFAPSLSNVKSGSARPFPTSAFTFTPPLNLPPAPAQASSANATLPLHREPVDILLSPHPPDVSLAAAQGLTSILSAMSVNHGLALEVVIAVYKRAGSLKEADRVLEGMREAAEEWAERALRKMGNHRDSDERADTAKHREMESWYRKEDDAVEDGSTRQSVSRRRSRRESQPGNKRITTELDYVLARPSDETPEYMPPETTRAAKWKRHSTGRTSRSPVGVHQNENPIQSSKDDNDEGECGQVEQMLINDEEGTLSHVEIHQLSHTDEPPRDRMHKEREEYHDIGALLQTMEPQELEKKLGKDNLRQQIGNLFNAK